MQAGTHKLVKSVGFGSLIETQAVLSSVRAVQRPKHTEKGPQTRIMSISGPADECLLVLPLPMWGWLCAGDEDKCGDEPGRVVLVW